MTSIKDQLKKLEKEKVAFLDKHRRKVQKVIDNCKHDFQFYRYEHDNYDRDIDTGFECRKCLKDISVDDYEKEYK